MTQQEPTTQDILTGDNEVSVNQAVGKQGLSLNDRFEILQNERRRFVLKCLSSSDGTVNLGTLADRIAAVENDTTVEAISSSERKRVYIALYQFHLPKMDRMGVIEYDKNRGDIAVTPNGQSLYREHEVEQSQDGYLDRFDIVVYVLGVVAVVGVVFARAWTVGSVLLGVQTGLFGLKIAASRML